VNDYLSKTGNDRDKIILGLPYYGYEWPTTSGSAGASTTGSGDAKFYSEAIALAESYGPLWNDESQTPWYRYQDGNNNWHQGWYDDSLSLSLKYELAIDEDLLGIGIWALGYDGTEPELWGALEDHFGTGLSVNSEVALQPKTPTLKVIYPNPSNIHVNFVIQIPQGYQLATAYIKIFDVLGRSVAEIPLPATPTAGGELTVTWNGKTSAGNLGATGTYTALLFADGQICSQKFILLK
jgi:hypothetical protein